MPWTIGKGYMTVLGTIGPNDSPFGQPIYVTTIIIGGNIAAGNGGIIIGSDGREFYDSHIFVAKGVQVIPIFATLKYVQVNSNPTPVRVTVFYSDKPTQANFPEYIE